MLVRQVQLVGHAAHNGALLSDARSILTEAKRSATQTIQHSRKRAAAHYVRKRARAVEAGFTEGLRRAESHHLKMIQSYEERYRRTLSQLEVDALHLAIKVAEQVIHTELTSNPDAMSAQIRLGLEEIADQRPLAIACHPQDVAAVSATVPPEFVELPPIVPDEAIPQGEARIDSRVGSLLINWRPRLARIQAELAARLTHRLEQGRRTQTGGADGESHLHSS